MKAILIAAGRGKRLGANTDELPKTLVPVGERSILGWQLRALATAGVDEVVIIRGYRGDVLEAGARATAPAGMSLRFVDNHAWPTNNVLLSLACARAELDGPTLVSYSDIIFTPAVAIAAAAGAGPIDLVIDADFRAIYEGRTEHPLDEGEVADLDASGRVRRVGKRALPPAEAYGEFIGLARFDAVGSAAAGALLDELADRYRATPDQPFQRAARYQNAYLTDLLQELIDRGLAINPVTIHGQWREIDTSQDLARAVALVQSASREWS
ncbi:MAG: phosphocholine cytidylyltransferase family protein [Kofleriaceae bacterium]